MSGPVTMGHGIGSWMEGNHWSTDAEQSHWPPWSRKPPMPPMQWVSVMVLYWINPCLITFLFETHLKELYLDSEMDSGMLVQMLSNSELDVLSFTSCSPAYVTTFYHPPWRSKVEVWRAPFGVLASRNVLRTAPLATKHTITDASV